MRKIGQEMYASGYIKANRFGVNRPKEDTPVSSWFSFLYYQYSRILIKIIYAILIGFNMLSFMEITLFIVTGKFLRDLILQ